MFQGKAGFSFGNILHIIDIRTDKLTLTYALERFKIIIINKINLENIVFFTKEHGVGVHGQLH